MAKAPRARTKTGQFVKKDTADAAVAAAIKDDVADTVPARNEAILPGLPKAVNGNNEDVSAIRTSAAKGLRRVEDWNEYEKQQQLLHPMLPVFINEREMKYILIGRESYTTYPLKDAVTPVTRDIEAFNVLPDEVFSNGIYSVGDSVVCCMDMEDYESHRYYQKSRMRARIDSLKSKEERARERAESGQEVEGTLVTGLTSTDDLYADPDREALIAGAETDK